MKSRYGIALIALLLYVGASASALLGQQAARDATRAGGSTPRTGAGSISGQAVSAETGRPLLRVQINLVGPARELPIVLTDDQGRFAFNNIDPGRYSITAAKGGYATLSYGQTRPGEAGRQIDLKANDSFNAANIALPAAGVIVARIADDLGDPVGAITVIAAQQRFVDGDRQFVTVARGNTDVRGERRLSGLLPGTYYISAVPSMLAADGGRTLGPTYFPGSDSRTDASPVTVTIGEEVRAPFALRMVKPANLSGTIRASDGAVGLGLIMRLVDRASDPAAARTIAQRADGSFTISNVLPGDYVIQVEPSSAAGGSREYASVPVTMLGEDVSLDVRTSRGGSARGHVVFDVASPTQQRPTSLLISAIPLERLAGRGPQSRFDAAASTFDVQGLTGPTLFRLASVGPDGTSGWYLKAVMLDGADVTDTPVDFSGDRNVDKLEVIVTREKTIVMGTVVDSNETAVTEYVVVLFPEDRQMRTAKSRFIAAARPDQSGSFSITGLPPGRYLAGALDYLPAGEERDPLTWQRLEENAMSVVLGSGDAKNLKLRRNSY